MRSSGLGIAPVGAISKPGGHTRLSALLVFDSWSLVFPLSRQLHDIGCTEDQLSKTSKTGGTGDQACGVLLLSDSVPFANEGFANFSNGGGSKESNPFDEEEEEWDDGGGGGGGGAESGERSHEALVDNGEPGVKVRALYDYDAAEEDEIEFKIGES